MQNSRTAPRWKILSTHPKDDLPITPQLKSNAAKSGSCTCNRISEQCYTDLLIKQGMQESNDTLMSRVSCSTADHYRMSSEPLSACRLDSSIRNS